MPVTAFDFAERSVRGLLPHADADRAMIRSFSCAMTTLPFVTPEVTIERRGLNTLKPVGSPTDSQ